MRGFGRVYAVLASCVASAFMLLADLQAEGQCPPIGNPAQSQSVQSSSELLQFFDEPKFTVAGVTDTTNLGGHGSDVGWRTKESLARQTVSLTGQDITPRQAPSGDSEQSLREAVEKNPGNFDANYRLGKWLADEGKAGEAVPYLERAAQLNSGSAKPEAADVHTLLGDVDESLNNPLGAVQEYQRAAELDPSENNFFNWGAELLVHRATEPAIEVFGKGSRLNPRSARMMIGLGVAWYVRGSYDQAAQCLCKASDLNPANPKPYLFLGRMQSVESAPSQGVAERLARFASLQPQNAWANYYYAVTLWQLRKGPDDKKSQTQVEALLEKAVQLDPKLGSGYLQLGILYDERKEYPNAISAYQKAIEATPSLEQAHYRLAQTYRLTGEKSKAQAELSTYQQVSKAGAEQAERERHEVQQFVYSLKAPGSAGQDR